MVSFSVIITNILALEINTVHMLHYDTIMYRVIVLMQRTKEGSVYSTS